MVLQVVPLAGQRWVSYERALELCYGTVVPDVHVTD
jgi:hypothetical protein